MSYGSLTLNDGHKIPRIAYGAGSVWDVTGFVSQALEEGFDHLDNAQYYANEQFVGAALAASGVARKDVFVTSKYGFGDVDEALNASLKKLQLDYLNLYLIHNPASIPAGKIPEVWSKLEAARVAGKAKSIGVSNFGPSQLQELLDSATVVPAVNQIMLHPYNYEAQLPTLKLCAEHAIAIEAYSSLNPITKTPGGPLDPVLARIAKRIGGTPAQVIFAWLRQKGVIIVTTSGKAERLREYLAVPSLPELTSEEIEEIEEAGRKGPEPEKQAYRFADEKRVPSTLDIDVEAQTEMPATRSARRYCPIILLVGALGLYCFAKSVDALIDVL
ncbi:hypothetical protein EXIGLDRAFT_721004 [Exidia glandulosa HHB12029]|uniref:NADP-dependent oxidoreductase domain-containing protein n=1 Tax=Exidia glandulosa HHB12029 TaxID=1314781 RepID=A0A165G2U3_EXIGL|nr:hypothetical protein EXIGLDRAFT_721004 [Exidia glandulosa HHB12029]